MTQNQQNSDLPDSIPITESNENMNGQFGSVPDSDVDFQLEFDSFIQDDLPVLKPNQKQILNWVTVERNEIPEIYQSVTGICPQEPDFNSCLIYLADPICARFFREFLQTEFSAENFVFLHHCNILDRVQDDFLATRRIMEINKQFIKSRTAKLEINIPNQVKNQIVDTISKYVDKTRLIPATDPRFKEFLIPRSIFNDARSEINILLRTDSIPRFLKSTFYENLRTELLATYKSQFPKLLSKKVDYLNSDLYNNSPPGVDTFIIDLGAKSKPPHIHRHHKSRSGTVAFSALNRTDSATSIRSTSSSGSTSSSDVPLSARSRGSSSSTRSDRSSLSAYSANDNSSFSRHLRTNSRSDYDPKTLSLVDGSSYSNSNRGSFEYRRDSVDSGSMRSDLGNLSPRSSGSSASHGSVNSRNSAHSSSSAASANSSHSRKSFGSFASIGSHKKRSSLSNSGPSSPLSPTTTNKKVKPARKMSLFSRRKASPKSSIVIQPSQPRIETHVHAPPKPREIVLDTRSEAELSAAELNAIMSGSYSRSKSIAGGIKLSARVDLDFVPVVYTGPSSKSSGASSSNTPVVSRKDSFDSSKFASLTEDRSNSKSLADESIGVNFNSKETQNVDSVPADDSTLSSINE